MGPYQLEEPDMSCYRTLGLGLLSAVILAVGLAAAGQATRQAEVDARVAVARTAAGNQYTALFTTLCTPPAPQPAVAAQPAPAPQGPPDRSTWHAEPVRVFDNLIFVGMTQYGAWAVTTSQGIIVLDAIFDYSVEDEIANGLRKVGLDPANIKYVVVSHGHIDHAAGAKYLQDHFGAHIVMSAEDWDLMDRVATTWPKPKRDMVATDGQQLTLGDETITLYKTPGHTLGTLSFLIPVRDGKTKHLAAEAGGTAFNWLSSRSEYITPERSDRFWFETYITSAERFRDIVAKAGADVLIGNHTNYDASTMKLPLVATRKPGDPHPYVIGNEGVQRYLTVQAECAKAGMARLN
jgi:metallo-beta-lactamase class B